MNNMIYTLNSKFEWSQLRSLFKLSFLAFFFLSMSATELEAETFYWRGWTDSDWHTPNNWDRNMIPGPGDDIIIQEGRRHDPVISDVAFASSIDLYGTLTLTTDGRLNIDDGNTNAIGVNESAVLINDGEINIGLNFTIRGVAIVNEGTVVNNGNIFTDMVGTSFSGTIFTLGIFTNNGLIEIRETRFFGFLTVNGGETINNGTMDIATSGGRGFRTINEGSTFDNYGVIRVPASSIFTNAGGFFTNHACGEVYATAVANVPSGGTFGMVVNYGFFSLSLGLTSSPNRTVYERWINRGVVRARVAGNGFRPINIGVIILDTDLVDNLGSYAPAFESGGVSTATFSVYTDAAGTISAGSYDAATNSFTPNAPLPDGRNELYVKIEERGCDPVIVPWVLNSSQCQMAQTCDFELAYWSLDDCVTDSLYNEFEATSTGAPCGMSTLGATSMINKGMHSCTPGAVGMGVCHAITDDCTFEDNSDNAYKFAVTINANDGYYGILSGLSFYENAPASYLWSNGQSGDNDPPRFYGIRVLKNGVEVFKQVGIAATNGYSLEEFDFSSNADFKVDEPTTFMFELLGYCRQSNSPRGPAVWDVDEIRVLGCSEAKPTPPPPPNPPTPNCDMNGGDADGDGVCADQDCDDNDASVNTYWTIVGDKVSVFNINAVHYKVRVYDDALTNYLLCESWGAVCNMDEMVTLAEGKYYLQIQTYDANWMKICDVFETFYIGPPPPPAGTCQINSTITNVRCDDKGTTNTNDDTFTFDITTDIINGGGWGYDVDGTRIMMQPSGTTLSFGPYSVNSGSVTLTIRDHDKPSCVTTVTGDPSNCSVSRPLPLKLNTHLVKGMVNLDWTNNTGWKNDYFIIERSEDGHYFEELTTVSSKGKSDSPLFYETLDKKPFDGFNYYRLAVTYSDSSKEYSPIEKLSIQTVKSLELFPNPANGVVNVSLKDMKGASAKIQIVDAFGKVVKTMRLDNARTPYFQINLDRMRNGIYAVWLFVEGRKPVSQKLVVTQIYDGRSY